MLEIRNLTAGYGGEPVLEDICLTIPRGKLTVIAGPNGCGKSTLLKAVAGILPAEGKVLLGGQELQDLSSRERARRIAYLPQNRQIPEITAGRLVLHGRFPYLSYPRRYRRSDEEIARKAMETLGIWDLADRNLNALSGGQRQKVYIAMALAQDTPVVLLDEPNTFLDISHQKQMMDLAGQLASAGKSVVMVLHDLPLAMEYADVLAVLSRGGVLAWGSRRRFAGQANSGKPSVWRSKRCRLPTGRSIISNKGVSGRMYNPP